MTFKIPCVGCGKKKMIKTTCYMTSEKIVIQIHNRCYKCGLDRSGVYKRK